jgi:hypothetical protein
MVFARNDARRVLDMIPKRLGKHGLTLHPDKIRRASSTSRAVTRATRPEPRRSTSSASCTTGGLPSGKWLVKQCIGKDRFSRSLHRVREWCRAHRHDRLHAQQQALAQKLRRDYGYFGISSNYRPLARFYREMRRACTGAVSAPAAAHRSPVWHVANPCLDEPDAGILHARICGRNPLGPRGKILNVNLPCPSCRRTYATISFRRRLGAGVRGRDRCSLHEGLAEPLRGAPP